MKIYMAGPITQGGHKKWYVQKKVSHSQGNWYEIRIIQHSAALFSVGEVMLRPKISRKAVQPGQSFGAVYQIL